MKRFLLPLVLSALTLAVPATSAAADGKALYSTTCVACHGANGKGAIPGVPDLGPRMTMTDDDLTNSILNGLQTKGSPLAMPAKGGNPALTAADVSALLVYLRTQLLRNSPQAPDPSAAEPLAAKLPTTAATATQKPPPAKPLTTAESPATPVAEHAPLASEPPTTAQELTPVSSSATAAAPAAAASPPRDMAAFTRGAKAWGEHCSSCHAMRDPKDFNDDQWKVITTHMRLRAGLDGADVRDITIFLTGSN